VQGDEYNWVTALFHQSMTRPRAHITKIQRVQNQILWQFYMVYVLIHCLPDFVQMMNALVLQTSLRLIAIIQYLSMSSTLSRKTTFGLL